VASRILIADDTPTVLDFLEIVFARQGFEVIKAGHGEQAVDRAVESIPDLILLDVMMPGIDGLEVCRRLRGDPRTARLPILLYSAVVGEEIRAQALAAGADEFLGKTLQHAELVSRVRDWMAARSTPGGVGSPALVEVGLDLVHMLEAELVWILGARQTDVQHLAIACERGEQSAVRFVQDVGVGPFPLEEGSFWGAFFQGGDLRLNIAPEELERAPGGAAIARALLPFGARGFSLLPLSAPGGERGVLAYTPPPMVAQGRRAAYSLAVAARYAAAALSLWGDLPRQAVLPRGRSTAALPPRLDSIAKAPKAD
jgi:DNA-binding response OmpR family regulator